MPALKTAPKPRAKPARKLDIKCRTLQEIGATIVAGGRGRAVLQDFARLVKERGKYRWVGIYRISRHEFVLDASTSETPPAYTQFPVSQGLSAVAIETRRTVMVRDVSKDKRFLPNFWTTRSEVIVPVIDDEHEKVVGVINVESGKLDAFDKSDRDFLEGVARLVWRAFR